MHWASMLAIYLLFWVMSAFVVMPFHVRTAADTGATVEQGHAESAPVNFRPKRILVWNTIVATLLFVAYYIIYTQGLISLEMFDMRNAALNAQ